MLRLAHRKMRLEGPAVFRSLALVKTTIQMVMVVDQLVELPTIIIHLPIITTQSWWTTVRITATSRLVTLVSRLIKTSECRVPCLWFNRIRTPQLNNKWTQLCSPSWMLRKLPSSRIGETKVPVSFKEMSPERSWHHKTAQKVSTNLELEASNNL